MPMANGGFADDGCFNSKMYFKKEIFHFGEFLFVFGITPKEFAIRHP
jgi:hypothetical protein